VPQDLAHSLPRCDQHHVVAFDEAHEAEEAVCFDNSRREGTEPGVHLRDMVIEGFPFEGVFVLNKDILKRVVASRVVVLDDCKDLLLSVALVSPRQEEEAIGFL
jgi:hypothetical protein